jgi:predicted O-methyltransferase YrrM
MRMGFLGSLRHRRRQAHAVAREARHLRSMPPRVAAFYLRAWVTLMRTHDGWSSIAVTRPSDVVRLLALARGRRVAVELGTGTAWTTTALALADDDRRVISYDPVAREERNRYLALVPDEVRERIDLRTAPGESVTPPPDSVDFLFIDCEHDRVTTGAAFRAWEPALRPGAVVAFHDYGHPLYPGVREAVDELGLRGEYGGGIFVWRKPG